MPENKGARGRFVKPGRGIFWALRGSRARGSWALILLPGAGLAVGIAARPDLARARGARSWGLPEAVPLHRLNPVTDREAAFIPVRRMRRLTMRTAPA